MMSTTVFLLATMIVWAPVIFAVGFWFGCRHAPSATHDEPAGPLTAEPKVSVDAERGSSVSTQAFVPHHEPFLYGDELEIACTQQAADGKIMIVDDEPINVKAAQKYLSLAGFRNIIGVTDARTVLNRIAEEQPDVLLLDILMPEISGLEILERLRATKEWAYLPVIVVTAFGNEVTKVQALELGATDFLCKPVNSVEMIPRVRNALLVKAHHDYLKRYAEELEKQTRQLQSQLVQAQNDGLATAASHLG